MKNIEDKITLTDTYTLNNGSAIPVIGMGTGVVIRPRLKAVCADLLNNKGLRVKKYFRLKKIIKEATDYGINMFDTSRAYGYSERLIGKATKDIKREDLFIVTKISNKDQRSGNVRDSLQKSLKELGLDYVDLYLLHWPQTDTFIDCWLQMEELCKEGLAKAIGVSNFHKHHLEKLMEFSTIIPAVNEIELHPLMNQNDLVEYCNTLGIKIIAYTPLGRMHEKLVESNTLKRISKKYGMSIAQVILKWHIQKGVIPIPSTTKSNRISEYVGLFNFELTNTEMKEIDDINIDLRLRYNPDTVDFSKV